MSSHVFFCNSLILHYFHWEIFSLFLCVQCAEIILLVNDWLSLNKTSTLVLKVGVDTLLSFLHFGVKLHLLSCWYDGIERYIADKMCKVSGCKKMQNRRAFTSDCKFESR